MKTFSIATAAVLLMGMAAPEDAAACRGIIGDLVWADTNGNGLQDPGEPGINGVTIRLIPAVIQGLDAPRSTVTTTGGPANQPGWYEFSGVPCDTDWTISVDATSPALAGYSPTMIHAGTDTAVDSNNHNGELVHLVNPNTGFNPPPDLTYDFGYVPPCTGAIGDFVWNDLNRNGQQDAGEPGIVASVQLDGNPPVSTTASGGYLFGGLCAGTYEICVAIPAGFNTSPANQGADATDSDGVADGAGLSCTSVTLVSNEVNLTIDFGFNEPPVSSPGTGTPGYWKNHLEVWADVILTIGGVSYTQAQAVPYMSEGEKDKTTTIFRALVSAKLNVLIGNEDSCVASTIAAADAWLATYGPVGSGVKANSAAWRLGEPLYRLLDNYNNGMLCAPGRS